MTMFRFTDEEIRTLIQGLELERAQYLRIYGNCNTDIVRRMSLQIIQLASSLILKLEQS